MPCEIEIYEPIGSSHFYDGFSPDKLRAQLKDADQKEEILLRIDSPGGEVFSAQAMISNLREHPGGYAARVDGLAASAASLLAVSANRVEMAEGAWMMIHNPHATTYEADAAEHMKRGALLKQMEDKYVRAYAAKCGKSEQHVREMMALETWMTDEECVELGFADMICNEKADAIPIAAYWREHVFHNMPVAFESPGQSLAASVHTEEEEEEEELTADSVRRQAQLSYLATVEARITAL